MSDGAGTETSAADPPTGLSLPVFLPVPVSGWSGIPVPPVLPDALPEPDVFLPAELHPTRVRISETIRANEMMALFIMFAFMAASPSEVL